MRCWFGIVVALQVALAATIANAQSIAGYDEVHQPVYGRFGMVAVQNRVPAEIGARVLEDGGSAVDAAVAIGFAVAVTLPRAGNIGGGGFMLIYDAATDEAISVDYREMAPLTATRDMFLDESGNVDPNLSRSSHKASAVPGTVAGLYLAHQRFGKLPWRRLVEPAIELARNGIVVTHDYATTMARNQPRNCRNEATCGYFYKPGKVPYEMGERLVQADLANTLQLIADQGPDAFYRGAIAQKIVAEMQAGGGLIDMASLAAYKPVWREPLRGNYRGYDLVVMPPSSSGGVHVLQALNILEHYPIAAMGSGSADEAHVLIEVMRLIYADRSEHLGDPDFYPVPVGWLSSEKYAAELAATIDLRKARPSTEVKPGTPPAAESEDTTHYSVIDADGNVVSNTYTLNTSYGSGISVRGAGFLLNNEMEDFVSKPGVANVFGLLGGEANAIEANKRPLSSMTPVIVFRDGKPWFATGSPGGARIISTVLQMLVNVMDHGMGIAEASAVPRLHHQWYPDEVLVESGYGPDTIRMLEGRGHTVKTTGSINTSLQTVAYQDGKFLGASDPRRPDSAAVAPVRTHVAGD
ncbi:MAG: gamma-glutamyltransferase [Gammaproteobacteria bacterium]|nr:gamma-glutamyltransferase [Gammaproteobacteria bacterium]MDH5302707.1 gamma-glutamyltransferase [Gammaproteobacteria bacterium]MDH5321904.1 gamma-glutamyltransferase [Gammaproteobacteria bacterium]